MHTKVARICGKKGDVDCAKAYVRLVWRGSSCREVEEELAEHASVKN